MKIDFNKRCLEFVSNAGNKLHPVRHGKILDDGTIQLVTDRLEDTDEIIDSYRKSTDIHNIIARINAGETNLLNQKQGFFGDVTELPKTYAEMLDLMHRGEEFFNKLPIEVKNKYNNDFNQFFARFDEAMNDLYPSQQKDAAASGVDDLAVKPVDSEVSKE